MDEVILRVLKGEASPFEEERLRRWRSEAEANEVHFQELRRIWELSGTGSATGGPPEADDQEVDTLHPSILAAAEGRRRGSVSPDEDRGRASAPGEPNRTWTGDGPDRARPRSRQIRTLALWGTSLAAGIGALALGVHQILERVSDDPSPSTVVSAASPTAETLRLEDGSYVRLAPASQLSVRFEEHWRTVSLRGRAFFAVTPDRNRPFLVRTGGAEVRVLGTRFEVAKDGDAVRAVVVEGRISLASPWGEVEVPAGSVGRAPPDRAPGAEPVADPWSLLDWPGGLLVFHETPLVVVIQEVAEHFGRAVHLQDDQAGSRRISAAFQGGESFREVLETLCVVTSTSCYITPDSAVIASIPGGGS